MYKSRTQQINI